MSAPIAPIPRRVVGYLIDAFLAAALGMLLYGAVVVAATLAGADAALGILVIGGGGASVLLLGWLLVYTFLQSRSGSVGMRVQGLRLARAEGDAPLGFGRALLRNVVFGLAGSVVVGYFSPLFDGSGRFQGWHDKAVGALMLDAREGASRPVTASAPPVGSAAAPPTTPTPRTPAPSGAAVSHVPPPGRPSAAPVGPRLPGGGTPPLGEPVSGVTVPADPGARGIGAAVADDGLIAFVPGVTPPSAAPAPAPAPAADLDETVLGERARARETAAPARVEDAETPAEPADADLESTRISIPGHRLVFTWDDGTRVAVSRPTVFGRNPAPQDGAVVVAVRDETLSLSKTHFEAAAEPSGGWIVDRHSTNGTVVVRSGERIACPPGQRVPVRLGDVIEIGERVVTIGGYA